MLIIPSIDLLNGRAVRLLQGDYDRVTEYGDPLTWMRRWQEQGAGLIHVVDLEAARDGEARNVDIIRAMADEGAAVEVGGGIRREGDVHDFLEAGAHRVVLGTAAVEDRQLVGVLARELGERVVVAIDARNGTVTTHGWTQTAGVSAESLAAALADLGVCRFLVTDVLRDGTLTEPNYAQLQCIAAASGRPVIASGGISSLEAIEKLRNLGLEAAIVGRALYDGLLTLRDAQDTADAG